MAESLLISDLHLAPERPALSQLFLKFLDRRARQAERLYILGDLFDAWIGDDYPPAPLRGIVDALAAASAGGTEILIMHGNRDFLIGEDFARRSGATLLADPSVANLYGTPTLLMHGDLLCTDDLAYQRFRAQIRDPKVIDEFLSRPLEQRLAIAADYRRRSGEAVSLKPEDIMDVNLQAVAEAMRRRDVSRLIHGHTHRPADHRFELDGRAAERIVLAQWREDAGEVLCVSPGGIRREAVE